MGLYDYLALSNEEQWEVLYEMGIQIDTYESIDCSFILYSLDRFFVEVELCREQGTVLGKNVFVHGHRMGKYIGDLENLFRA